MKMFNCNLGGNLSGNTKCKVPKVVGFTLLGVVGAGALIVSGSAIVKGLWNWLLTDLFGFKRITLKQAFGLTILAKFLFGGGGFSHSNSGGHSKKKYIKKDILIKEEDPSEDEPKETEEPVVEKETTK